MKKKILAVDDSRVMRDLLGAALISAGYDVATAEDGEHGLRMAQEHRPDAIITDINMPKMDGFEFMETIRQDTAFRSTPILVLTTEFSKEKKARARNAGATGWIVKPFEHEKLIAALRRVVR